jgi:Zn-dependent protease
MARRGDPMRTFAQCCVAAGISIAVLGVAYVPFRDSMIEREIAALGPLVFHPTQAKSAARSSSERSRLV